MPVDSHVLQLILSAVQYWQGPAYRSLEECPLQRSQLQRDLLNLIGQRGERFYYTPEQTLGIYL